VAERALRQVPGVADVVAMGGSIKQYEVQPDLDKLRAYGSTSRTCSTPSGAATRTPAAAVAQGAQQYTIRGLGLLKSSDDIGRIVVAARNGTPILVRDIAQVKIGAVPRLGWSARTWTTTW
jgi:cobalt-zinc-cadmium resistance protein CzcA